MDSRIVSTPPDSHLLLIMSFLMVDELLQIETINHQWQSQIKKSPVWLSSIKPQFLQQCRGSISLARELYLKNIDARIDTFFCIGILMKVCSIPSLLQQHPKPFNLTSQQFLKTFYEKPDKEYMTYYNREDAIKFATGLSEQCSINDETSVAGIYSYPPVLTIQLKSKMEIENLYEEIPEEKFDKEGKLQIEYRRLPYFMLFSGDIKKIYQVYYQAGLQSKEFLVKGFVVEKKTEEKISKCLIC